MHFPVSGVDCPIWLPPAVSFVIATLVTPAGLSGAFVLLPFQMSVLGFLTPAVTPTNLIYNIVAIPGGVYQYIRERRMVWPLTWAVMLGTLPGVFAGAFIRIRYLPDPRPCKLFVGLVLLYMGSRLLADVRSGKTPIENRFKTRLPAAAVVKTTFVSARRIEYEFWGEKFSFSPAAVLILALLVGVAGGIYGVGGGAIIAPYVVAMLHLPAYTIAGAALLGTFLTSIAGVTFFELLGRTSMSAGLAVQPDWALGILFGVGGLAGSYCGARLQKYLPERSIKLFLGLVVVVLGAAFVIQFFLPRSVAAL